MKKLLFFQAVNLTGYQSFACVTCNKQIQETLFDSTFYPNLFIMLSTFRDINHSGNLLSGGLLLGWGLFNIVEGIIDHHLLKLHNVREITENVDAWNYGFLGLSVLLILGGFALTNQERKVG